VPYVALYFPRYPAAVAAVRVCSVGLAHARYTLHRWVNWVSEVWSCCLRGYSDKLGRFFPAIGCGWLL